MNYDTATKTAGRPQYATDAAIERAPSAVSNAQAGLDSNTNRLHSILGELEDRLRPVLGASKPNGVKDSTNPPSSSVSSRINDSAAVVAAAIARVEDILNRLEV